MEHRLARLVTSDGLSLPACLGVPDAVRGGWPVDAAVFVHGSAHDLSSPPLRQLADGLTSAGLLTLTFSNRGHDVVWQDAGRYFGHAFEDLEESVSDIDAAIGLLVQLGARRVALVGHSLGVVKSAWYAAGNGSPGQREMLGAVVCVSPPRFPAAFLSGSRWAAEFRDACRRVDDAAAEGPDTLIEINFPFRRTFMAVRTHRQKYCGESFDVVGLMPQIQAPVLLTQGCERLPDK